MSSDLPALAPPLQRLATTRFSSLSVSTNSVNSETDSMDPVGRPISTYTDAVQPTIFARTSSLLHAKTRRTRYSNSSYFSLEERAPPTPPRAPGHDNVRLSTSQPMQKRRETRYHTPNISFHEDNPPRINDIPLLDSDPETLSLSEFNLGSDRDSLSNFPEHISYLFDHLGSRPMDKDRSRRQGRIPEEFTSAPLTPLELKTLQGELASEKRKVDDLECHNLMLMIECEASRMDLQVMRYEYDSVLTGIKQILNETPIKSSLPGTPSMDSGTPSLIESLRGELTGLQLQTGDNDTTLATPARMRGLKSFIAVNSS